MKYFSEILDKKFDTAEELKAAEAQHLKEEAEKAETKALVKKESQDVEEAFKARNEARRAYNARIIELRKTYNEALLKARDAFNAEVEKAHEELDKAEVSFNDKLTAFQKAHGNYHITLHDGDNVVTYTGSHHIEDYPDLAKEFDNILNIFTDALTRW